MGNSRRTNEDERAPVYGARQSRRRDSKIRRGIRRGRLPMHPVNVGDSSRSHDTGVAGVAGATVPELPGKASETPETPSLPPVNNWTLPPPPLLHLHHPFALTDGLLPCTHTGDPAILPPHLLSRCSDTQGLATRRLLEILSLFFFFLPPNVSFPTLRAQIAKSGTPSQHFQRANRETQRTPK